MKTLGLTFGGGGTKGFAHVGLYKVFHDAGLAIHSIAGCSIGAMVGAAIAQGKTPEEILEVMNAFAEEQSSFFRFDNFSLDKGALLKGEDEVETVKRLIPEDLQFEDLKIPLVVNAVDLEKGETVVISRGNVLQAVLASMSIPGIFPPVYMDGRLLVDGGVLNSIPVDLCKTLGAEVQVGINLRSFYTEQNIAGLIYHFYIQKDPPKHYFQNAYMRAEFLLMVMLRSIAVSQEGNQQKILEFAKPDLLIHPDVAAYNFLDASKHMEIYEKGLEAGKKALPEIQALL